MDREHLPGDVLRVAEAWWRYYGPTAPSIDELKGDEYERAAFVDSEVASLSNDENLLTALLVALVRTAPSLEQIPYIGTVVAEDAEIYLGARVSGVLRELPIPPDQRDLLLSGYQPGYDVK